jgi:hypothetical protein
MASFMLSKEKRKALKTRQEQLGSGRPQKQPASQLSLAYDGYFAARSSFLFGQMPF